VISLVVVSLVVIRNHSISYPFFQSLSPGRVGTEFGKPTSAKPLNIPMEVLLKFKDMPKLTPEDVAAAVVFVLQTPPSVLIQELKMAPLGQFH